MPGERRLLWEHSRTRRDHLNQILAHSVTHKPLILSRIRADKRIELAFRDGGRHSSAPLSTRYGIMQLFINQVCDTVPTDDSTRQLRVILYQYAIRPQYDPEPLFRWEYVSRIDDPNALWCRHHVQGPLPVTLRSRTMPLNDLHLPTGPVPLAEVLRFCIVDLGVRPLSEDWDERLQASIEQSNS